jgi:hypothetical protein
VPGSPSCAPSSNQNSASLRDVIDPCPDESSNECSGLTIQPRRGFCGAGRCRQPHRLGVEDYENGGQREIRPRDRIIDLTDSGPMCLPWRIGIPRGRGAANAWRSCWTESPPAKESDSVRLVCRRQLRALGPLPQMSTKYGRACFLVERFPELRPFLHDPHSADPCGSDAAAGARARASACIVARHRNDPRRGRPGPAPKPSSCQAIASTQLQVAWN